MQHSDIRVILQQVYPINWDKLRRIVYKRAKYICQYCRERYQGINAHHIIALSKGGKNDLNNLICICDQCHSILHPTNSRLKIKRLINDINLENIMDGFFPEITDDKIYNDIEIFMDEQGFHSIFDNI